jgi:hypothetical protein
MQSQRWNSPSLNVGSPWIHFILYMALSTQISHTMELLKNSENWVLSLQPLLTTKVRIRTTIQAIAMAGPLQYQFFLRLTSKTQVSDPIKLFDNPENLASKKVEPYQVPPVRPTGTVPRSMARSFLHMDYRVWHLEFCLCKLCKGRLPRWWKQGLWRTHEPLMPMEAVEISMLSEANLGELLVQCSWHWNVVIEDGGRNKLKSIRGLSELGLYFKSVCTTSRTSLPLHPK